MFITTNYDCPIEEIRITPLSQIKVGHLAERNSSIRVTNSGETGIWLCCLVVNLFIWEKGDMGSDS